MPLSFPPSPSLNDEYTFNSLTWRWNGSEWESVFTPAVGPQGPQGEKGDGWTGAAYDSGTGVVTFSSADGLGFSTDDLRGDQGIQGEVGPQGPQGPQGVKGDGFTGGSYNGVTGVVTFSSGDGLGFSTSDLRGGQGPQGVQGIQGEVGLQGPQGVKGDGWTAASYDSGTGVVTFSSTDGLGFSTGDLRGAQGIQGEVGPQGVQGIQGEKGDGFTGGSYNSGTGVITFTSTDGLGFSTTDVRGEQGIQGVQGVQGVQGEVGPQGPQGVKGDGWTGATYDGGTGIVTFISADGLGFSTGDLRGATGPQGPQGAQGIQGEIGPQGPAGIGVPSGTFIQGGWTTDPDGYLILDGRTIVGGATTYSVLAGLFPSWVSGADLMLPYADEIVLLSTFTSPGVIGGSNTHTLTEAQLPAHAHTASLSGSTGSDSHSHGGSTGSDSHSHSGTTGSDSHTHTYSKPATASYYYNTSAPGVTRGFSTSSQSSTATSSDSHSHSFSTSSDSHSHSVSTDTDSHSHSVSVSGTTGTTGAGDPIDHTPAHITVRIAVKT